MPLEINSTTCKVLVDDHVGQILSSIEATRNIDAGEIIFSNVILVPKGPYTLYKQDGDLEIISNRARIITDLKRAGIEMADSGPGDPEISIRLAGSLTSDELYTAIRAMDGLNASKYVDQLKRPGPLRRSETNKGGQSIG